MGGACSTYGEEQKYIQVCGEELWVKETNWKIQGVDGRIILRWIFRKGDVGIRTGSSWLSIRTGDGQL